jgi:hypothetical protein
MEMDLMSGVKKSWIAALLAIALFAGGCADFWGKPDPVHGDGVLAWVEPDRESSTLYLDVILTDEGPEPKTLFIPAGRHIRLTLRNRGAHEHHYRVDGLRPEDMRWILFPEIDEYELAEMTPEELEALDVGRIDDVEHVLHHLRPVFVPFREESLSGIKPLANEVHGYTQRGQIDVVTFYATNTGRFAVEDLRYPELTAEVVVFEVDP